jgi:NAD(P)-dependent dehydrogenase (short-subunit alcohol dehydrogenase family)
MSHEGMQMRMTGRRALITGGASGIGAAIAERFAAEGAGVVLFDLPDQQPLADALIARIAERGGTAQFVAGDVRSRAELDGAVAHAAARFGGLDAVVAAAGIAIGGPLLATAPADWARVLDVNLTGVLQTVQAAAPHLIAAPGATVVTIASTAAKRPGAGAYSVSKAAVWMLTRGLAEELAPGGVRVNAIGPGFIDTPMLDRSRELAGDAWYDALPAQIPLGRIGTPEEIAGVALFLSTAESSYLTGSILHPDGGWINRHGGG